MGCGGSKESVATSNTLVPRRSLLCRKSSLSQTKKASPASDKVSKDTNVLLQKTDAKENECTADEQGKLIAKESPEEYFSTRKDGESVAETVNGGTTAVEGVEYYSPPHEMQQGVVIVADGETKVLLEGEKEKVSNNETEEADGILSRDDSVELKETILIEKSKAAENETEQNN